MPTTRLIFAALLLIATLAAAQQAQPQNAAAKAAPAHNALAANRPSQPEFEPLRLTITFKRIRSDKTTTHKTYTVTASSQQSDPQIRDDSRIPIKRDASASTSSIEYINGNTDVDVQNIRKAGNVVSLTLRISQEGNSEPLSKGLPDANAILSSHRYTVSPTVPLAKETIVYLMTDEINNYKVEVLLLIEPLNKK